MDDFVPGVGVGFIFGMFIMLVLTAVAVPDTIPKYCTQHELTYTDKEYCKALFPNLK